MRKLSFFLFVSCFLFFFAGKASAADLFVSPESGDLGVGQQFEATVRAQDSRGALSLPVRSPELRVRERPAFVIGNFEVSQFWLFTGLIIILVGSFSSGFITYRLHNRKHRQRIADKIIIAERDIHGSFSTINQTMDKFNDALKDGKVDPKEVTELKFGTEKLKKNLEKMEEYIVEGIEEIKD
jgi:hypothetical protein